MVSMGMFEADDQAAESTKVELDNKLVRALREDSVDPSIVLEELESLNDGVLDHSNTRFRIRLERFLESTPLEIFLVALVIIDVVILLAMLLMDLNVLHYLLEDGRSAAKLISSDLHHNCEGNPALNQYNGSNLIKISRYLEHYGCIWEPFASNDTNSTLVKSHQESVHHRRKRSAGPVEEGTNPSVAVLYEIGHIFHILSIAILAIMLFEVCLKIFALGRKYFKEKLEVVDGIIILISFTLDLFFIDGVSPGGVNNGSTVLVIFLLWRMLRVFNALLVTAKKRLQFRIRVQKRMRKALEDKVEALGGDIHNHESHIENLTRLAKRHALPDYEVKACKPLVKQVKRANTSAGLASMMHMSMGLMHGMNNIKSAEPAKSSIAGNLRNPPLNIKEEEEEADESLSDVMVNAMIAAENSNTPVDVQDNSKNMLPVPLMTAIATNGNLNTSPNLKRSGSSSSSGKEPHIPSIEFARAIATGSSDSHSNSNGASGAHPNLNDSDDKENNNPNSNHKIITCS